MTKEWARTEGTPRTERSPWLLTGKNLLAEPFFTCRVCGANVVSWTAGKNNLSRYACGDVAYRGGVSCVPLAGINKAWLERLILRRIVQRCGTPRAVARLVRRVNESLRARGAAATAASRADEKLQSELAAAESKLANLNAAIEAGANPAALAQNINAAYAEIERLKRRATAYRADRARVPPQSGGVD